VTAVAAVAGVASVVLGAAAMCVGTLLAFPLVISVLLYGAATLGPNSFAAITMLGALLLEVTGLGLVLLGPRLWPRIRERHED
jgi:hypothetical protein